MTQFLIGAPWSQPRAVASRLVTPPTEEPLTLVQAKLRAGLDWPDGDPMDGLMNSFIAAARSQVEQDTGLALITQTRDVFFMFDPSEYGLFPISGAGSQYGYGYWAPAGAWIYPLPWQALPLQSMDALTVQPVNQDVTIDSGTGFVTWAQPPTGAWRIVSGWPDAATLLLEAPLLVQAVGLLVAHFATAGRDLVSDRTQSKVPYGYEEAIAPYRLMWVA
jgi:hypothetical protein